MFNGAVNKCKCNCHVMVQCLTALLISVKVTAIYGAVFNGAVNKCKGNCNVMAQCLTAQLISVKLTAMLWRSV